MIDYACLCQIKHLHEQQRLRSSQIAAPLSRDPRTVAYWLTQERFRSRKPRARPSKRDPFKAQMVRMLETYPYAAAQIWQRRREQGFDGGYSIVKAYVCPVRPRRQAAFRPLAFAPGAWAKGRWGLIRLGQGRPNEPPLALLCYGPVLQPHDVC